MDWIGGRCLAGWLAGCILWAAHWIFCMYVWVWVYIYIYLSCFLPFLCSYVRFCLLLVPSSGNLFRHWIRHRASYSIEFNFDPVLHFQHLPPTISILTTTSTSNHDHPPPKYLQHRSLSPPTAPANLWSSIQLHPRALLPQIQRLSIPPLHRRQRCVPCALRPRFRRSCSDGREVAADVVVFHGDDGDGMCE